MCVYIYIYTHTHIYKDNPKAVFLLQCFYVIYISISTYICAYIYEYICICIYIYINTYKDTLKAVFWCFFFPCASFFCLLSCMYIYL